MKKRAITTRDEFLDDDIIRKVILELSPVEWLILNCALKQFIVNKNNHPFDIEKAKEMDLVQMECEQQEIAYEQNHNI